jgi:hypothetical protein
MHRARPAAGLAAVLLASVVIVAGPPPASAATGRGTVQLRVMTLNIFHGGDELNLASGKFCAHSDGCPETLVQLEAEIRAAAPDVVGIEEGEHNVCVIAAALGWNCSARLQIISRLPIIDPPAGNAVYIFVEVAPGKVAALMNVHLLSDPYGPDLVRDGGTPEQLRALEDSTRLPAIHDQVAALPGLVAAGIPVFLTGDFNSPSRLDWTPAVVAARKEVRFPFDWPVSKALADAGFRDGYRVVHPDPVAVPGLTWSPGGPETAKNEVFDRIDWVLSAGAAVPTASTVVGEPGDPDAGVTISPYPTDHRGVVTTFEVTPGAMPILVAVGSRRVFAGETLAVRFHARGRNDEAVAIVPAGGGAASAVARRATGGGTDGTLSFVTAGLTPGAYEAALLDASGAALSRSPFWLYATGTAPSVMTAKSLYVSGEPIEVSWKADPGLKWDWLGVYSPGAADSHYDLYTYTRTAIEGTTTLRAASSPGAVDWPLPPGTYEIRLLLDDGYRSLASSAPFKVVKP